MKKISIFVLPVLVLTCAAVIGTFLYFTSARRIEEDGWIALNRVVTEVRRFECNNGSWPTNLSFISDTNMLKFRNQEIVFTPRDKEAGRGPHVSLIINVKDLLYRLSGGQYGECIRGIGAECYIYGNDNKEKNIQQTN